MIGFVLGMLCAGLFGFVVHLARIQARNLAMPRMPEDERRLIEDQIGEEDRALRALYDAGHIGPHSQENYP